jgi:7,8-dihydropterin-6-yl-methyl-4-(beta-D-ribofuranosyl)aminobenzene 5'-phosphate synthase
MGVHLIFKMEGVMKDVLAVFIIFVFGLTYMSSAHPLEGDTITITILYDNYPFKEGLKTDWGFSCIIEGAEKTILFDTGTKSDILFHNIESLKVNTAGVELVALSHVHGDHTGGLAAFLKTNNKVTVYVPKSFPASFKKRVEDSGAKVVSVSVPVEICEGVHLTGEMFGPANELAIILDTNKGLVVITGCAHPGIVGMVKRAKEVVNKDVHLVFGGFHLMNKSDAELKAIIGQFKDLGVQKVGATHCTGDRAIELFKQAYGENFIRMGVGKIIQIRD